MIIISRIWKNRFCRILKAEKRNMFKNRNNDFFVSSCIEF